MKLFLKFAMAIAAVSGFVSMAAADCMLQSNGQTVCGAGRCELNSDGTATCADVPWGQCSFGSDGNWSCE